MSVGRYLDEAEEKYSSPSLSYGAFCSLRRNDFTFFFYYNPEEEVTKVGVRRLQFRA